MAIIRERLFRKGGASIAIPGNHGVLVNLPDGSHVVGEVTMPAPRNSRTPEGPGRLARARAPSLAVKAGHIDDIVVDVDRACLVGSLADIADPLVAVANPVFVDLHLAHIHDKVDGIVPAAQKVVPVDQDIRAAALEQNSVKDVLEAIFRKLGIFFLLSAFTVHANKLAKLFHKNG